MTSVSHELFFASQNCATDIVKEFIPSAIRANTICTTTNRKQEKKIAYSSCMCPGVLARDGYSQKTQKIN